MSFGLRRRSRTKPGIAAAVFRLPLVGLHAAKAQQIRWSRATVQPFLDMRTAVLNDMLEGAFRRCRPSFWPANDDQPLLATA